MDNSQWWRKDEAERSEATHGMRYADLDPIIEVLARESRIRINKRTGLLERGVASLDQDARKEEIKKR